MTVRTIAMMLAGTLLLAGSGNAGAQAIPHRLIYASHNLLVDQNVEELLQIMQRGARAGYTGIVLADYKLNILDRMDDHYFRNVARVKEAAAELGLEIVPAVFPIGYSEGLLAHNPNLAAALPVRDAPFIVRDGVARIASEPVPLANGDFEAHDGDVFDGWAFQDAPGQITHADTDIVESGSASLRIDNVGAVDPENGHGRIHQVIDVTPFRQYRLSVWIRTRDFDRAANVRVALLTDDGRSLNYADLGVAPTQDWTQHNVVFNSLDHGRVRLYLGVWEGKDGALWFDDLRIEEIGLLHVVRREGTPISVRGEDGTLYEEGNDYERIEDPRLREIGYHEPPVIRLTADSRMREGERLRVSYYHTTHIYGSQIPVSLIEPEVFELLRDQAERVQALFEPAAFFMSHDEIRIAGWDALSEKSGKTPGELLADNVRRAISILKDVNPTARIYVWSDMFDPNHNAHDGYYLVNGSFAGSWEGLTPDVIIANWYYRKRRENMPFFAKRGHRQLLAGYYDGDPSRIATWLADARDLGVPVDGVLYTTWRRQYGDLEAFADAAWGKREE